MLLTASPIDDYKYRMVDCRLICDDALSVLRDMPAESVDLTVTSPPYNLGKEYEKRIHLDDYIAQQKKVIHECVLYPALQRG